MMGGSKKKKSGPLISFFKPAAPPAAAPATVVQAAPAFPAGVRYPVGQVVTLPNGQRALIQSFGGRKIKV